MMSYNFLRKVALLDYDVGNICFLAANPPQRRATMKKLPTSQR